MTGLQIKGRDQAIGLISDAAGELYKVDQAISEVTRAIGALRTASDSKELQNLHTLIDKLSTSTSKDKLQQAMSWLDFLDK